MKATIVTTYCMDHYELQKKRTHLRGAYRDRIALDRIAFDRIEPEWIAAK
jgi:hypothetical protein